MRDYSTSQMDNFYETLASGLVKPSGIMNYMQHLFVAQRCQPGSTVLDVCCGRALMVPLLKRYSPSIASYMGIDISSENLSEAQRIILLGNGRMPEFPCELIQGDVTRLSSLTLSQFDIVVYLSALEHLNREDGLRSLGEVSRALAENGRLYLSTPNTPEENSRKLQHRVHIYEWSFKDIRSVLEDLKMTITNSIGLLPPPEELLLHLIDEKYGVGGVRWFEDMQACVPEAFLAPVVAASFPEFANEILFICQKKRG